MLSQHFIAIETIMIMKMMLDDGNEYNAINNNNNNNDINDDNNNDNDANISK